MEILDSTVLSAAASFPLMQVQRLDLPRSSPPPTLPTAHGVYFIFCLSGGMRAIRSMGGDLRLCKRDILLFSSTHTIQTFRLLSSGFLGYLVQADASDDTAGPVQQALTPFQGATVLRGLSWQTSLFDALERLPAMRQQAYCILKANELLYLLCSGGFSLPQVAQPTYYDAYQQEAVHRVEQYMLAHLGEHMTIPALAHKFRLSPTLLKNCFRQLYGEPVHSYLRTKRLEKAAGLLGSTSLSVLQIASTVGYSSVSQFGAAFRQRYHMTPMQYRRALQYENV